MKKIYFILFFLTMNSYGQKEIKSEEYSNKVIEYLKKSHPELHFLELEKNTNGDCVLPYVEKNEYENNPLEDLIKEYYVFNSNKIIKADLNNDKHEDVLVKLERGAFESRSYEFSYLIAVNSNGKLKFIQNSFGGNDVSDITSIEKVSNRTIYISFQKFNNKTFMHDKKIIRYKRYQLIDNKIVEK
ncbi:MAG: hypothetical protein QM486_02225 [Flavobacteriaceae bacterium]